MGGSGRGWGRRDTASYAPGNVTADDLVKQAATNNEVDIGMPVSLTENEERIERFILRQ